MLISQSQSNRSYTRRVVRVALLDVLLVWMIVLIPVSAHAKPGGIEILSVDPNWAEGVYQVNAIIVYELSTEALDALESGVSLTFSVDVVILRSRKYWLDEKVAILKQQFQLRYHALSDQYILANLNSGAINSFPTLKGALTVMGSMVDLPLFDDKLLNPSLAYFGRMRARLDIDSLPAPLRILAYVKAGWRLTSDWLTWNVIQN